MTSVPKIFLDRCYLFPVADIVSGLSALLQLAIAANSAAVEQRPFRDARRVSTLLRGIYFSPNGILPILKKLRDDEAVSEEELRAALAKFRDAHFDIEYDLQSLDWTSLRDDLGLSIPAIHRLGKIGREKMGLRSAILRFIHDCTAKERKPKHWRETLSGIIEKIEELNAVIEHTEQAVNPHLR